jgi:hypothetical protein
MLKGEMFRQEDKQTQKRNNIPKFNRKIADNAKLD